MGVGASNEVQDEESLASVADLILASSWQASKIPQASPRLYELKLLLRNMILISLSTVVGGAISSSAAQSFLCCFEALVGRSSAVMLTLHHDSSAADRSYCVCVARIIVTGPTLDWDRRT